MDHDRRPHRRRTAQDHPIGLEYERKEALRPDPLTGWAGSGDTETQLRLSFDSKDEALAYAATKGLEVHLVPAAPATLKLQAYADNFR